MADSPTVLTWKDALKTIRFCSLGYGKDLVSKIGPELEAKLPTDWINGLNMNDQTICYRAILICWATTGQIPRRMQLEAVIADRNGKHILVSAGTGSGKTLPMALNILLDNPARQLLSITLSPLKRLMVSQSGDFNSRYRIPTVVINEDTPRDYKWYSKWIWDVGNRVRGAAIHAIITTEQLDKSKASHWPIIAALVRNLYLQRFIARINVDEAHCIYTDGLPHHGLDAFRPAWGRLDELQAVLPRSIQWSLFLATFPPHILKTATKKLLSRGYECIHVTSNRPSTTYSFHEVENIESVRNYECFLVPCSTSSPF